MDNTLLIIVFFLFLIILVLVGIIGFFMFMFFKQQRVLDNSNSDKPAEKPMKVKFEPIHGHCVHHPTEKAGGTCNICEHPYCEHCLHTHEALNFCDEHYQIFLESKWVEIDSVQTTPSHPEKGTRIYKFKNHLWKNSEIPTYLQTHYKINHDTDEIESIVCLYAATDAAEVIKNKLKTFKV